MKKFIFSMVMFFTFAMSALAQNYATSNYVGSSKFGDNWSITLQGGILTTMDNFFAGHTACAPIVVLGVDKYVNRWLGFGFDGRTLIGTGTVWDSRFNSHTAFDAFNLNGYVKLNILNIFSYSGKRKLFEPVLYTGLGWNHICTSDVTSLSSNYSNANGVPTEYVGQMLRNSLIYRVGCELNFNLGKNRAWALVLNPSVVFGNVDNFRLTKKNGDFELTAGFVYHFKTSNGTHGFAKAKLYDQSEIDALNARIKELENQPAKVVEKVVTNNVATSSVDKTYVVNFAQNSSELTDAAKAILDKIPENSIVNVAGATSPEGSYKRNCTLSQERANKVAEYLKNRGVKVNSATGKDAGRVAVVTLQ